MQLSFIVCYNYRGRGPPFRSAMDRRIKIMGHIPVGLMMFIVELEMTRLDMVYNLILQIIEVMDTCIIIVIVQTCTILVIVITLTGGVLRDTFQMSLRK